MDNEAREVARTVAQCTSHERNGVAKIAKVLLPALRAVPDPRVQAVVGALEAALLVRDEFRRRRR